MIFPGDARKAVENKIPAGHAARLILFSPNPGRYILSPDTNQKSATASAGLAGSRQPVRMTATITCAAGWSLEMNMPVEL
jgi:hypothetical protein